MTYEEFTALAKREISTTEYHEVVEPVYTYHPAIPNKETAAKLYDLCGLQVFRDMKPTAKRIRYTGVGGPGALAAHLPGALRMNYSC